MTIAERNNKLKHFTTCLKCEVSGKCCDDNCSTQYDAGNMGEIIENLEAISKALEQEPKTGHWINQHVVYANATIDFKVCSECRYEFSYDAETGVSDANYCPNCGCRMVESQESEDKEC